MLGTRTISTLMEKMVALPTIDLPEEEAKRFVELVFDESVLKNHAQQIPMTSVKKQLRGLGMTGDVLFPEATFDADDYRTTISHDLQTLETQEFRACIQIFDSDLEDMNIGSSAAFKSQIMSMTAKKIATQLDRAYWIADEEDLSGFEDTDIRSTFNGWRYRLDHSQDGEEYENDVTGSCVLLDASNTIDDRAASFDIVTDQLVVEQDIAEPFNQEYKFAKMISWFPSEYKTAGMSKLRFFMNDKQASDYIEALSNRATAIGDSAILGKSDLQYGGVPIIIMPLMPTVMEINGADDQKENYDADAPGNLTDVILTHEKNFVIGIQKKITMETSRSAEDRATRFFFVIRPAVAIEDVHACVMMKRVL